MENGIFEFLLYHFGRIHKKRADTSGTMDGLKLFSHLSGGKTKFYQENIKFP